MDDPIESFLSGKTSKVFNFSFFMAIVIGCIAIKKNLQAYCARYGAQEKSINHLSFSVHRQFKFGTVKILLSLDIFPRQSLFANMDQQCWRVFSEMKNPLFTLIFWYI